RSEANRRSSPIGRSGRSPSSRIRRNSWPTSPVAPTTPMRCPFPALLNPPLHHQQSRVLSLAHEASGVASPEGGLAPQLVDRDLESGEQLRDEDIARTKLTDDLVVVGPATECAQLVPVGIEDPVMRNPCRGIAPCLDPDIAGPSTGRQHLDHEVWCPL